MCSDQHSGCSALHVSYTLRLSVCPLLSTF
uniref:Uncharacterized protein n=1 Tax=Anguilla anguilla TaxID=7936 RepID=A0A0E9SE38_ANGAN